MLLLSTSFLAMAQIPEYVLDTTWAPVFPPGAHTFSGVAVQYGRLYVTQRGNTSLEPILVLNTTDGRMQTSFGSSEIGISKSTPPTWGAHGIATTYVENVDTRVYINDFSSFMLWGFDQRSPDFAPWSKATRAALRIGTPGKQGVGNHPVQFGHLADTAVHHPPYLPPYSTNHIVYVADGDGGSANRVVALATTTGHPPDEPSEARFLWATPSNYHNPHSITFHARTKLLLIADRENNRTRVLQSSDGKDLGNLECGLDLGPRGKPFGVRTWSSATADLLFMAIMDNPQVGHTRSRPHPSHCPQPRRQRWAWRTHDPLPPPLPALTLTLPPVRPSPAGRHEPEDRGARHLWTSRPRSLPPKPPTYLLR